MRDNIQKPGTDTSGKWASRVKDLVRFADLYKLPHIGTWETYYVLIYRLKTSYCNVLTEYLIWLYCNMPLIRIVSGCKEKK